MSESADPAKPATTGADRQPATKPTAEQPTEQAKKAKKPKPAKQRKPATPEQQERRKAIIRWVVFIGVGAILTVLLYFLLSALIPRWWAQVVGRQAGGRISTGILLGLSYGFVFTLLPLVVLAQAMHRSFSWRARTIIVLVAAALTAPNLMTLGISIGNSPAAHAGERTLDVTAPGFRQATLWGVILGAVTGAIVITLLLLWERRGQELKLLRARLDQLEKELPSALPTPPESPDSR
ncbi:hypothetical protein MLP_53090 [Microlunatus phosphovorus NM-1]|uniref:Permease n=1 Tax=Microlunatus phosphovorus (strain ATCC 700054 / DSM 10555 / JCM 9379 / NBRC 101784 / NCIMB 13414 / VKM Ac-1990 / NM-1) TaxID=1032480 RepID=F5XIT5_MICPN|nr:hypothetical protein [Microlunatus phosphovorus]BAK38323.1 hypothetical protein MLP_53090 [Microlunatus phosphovorus NM-1]